MCALGGGASQQHLLRMEGCGLTFRRGTAGRECGRGKEQGSVCVGLPESFLLHVSASEAEKAEGKIGRLQGLREPKRTVAPVVAAGRAQVNKAPNGAGHTGCSNRKVAVGGFAFQAWVAAVAAAGVGGAM